MLLKATIKTSSFYAAGQLPTDPMVKRSIWGPGTNKGVTAISGFSS